MQNTPILSKSRFLAGLQCPLRLWYQCYARELAAQVSPSQQAVFDTGHAVGRLATRLYPGGVAIEEDHQHHNEAVQSTLKAMRDSSVKAIYEAAFFYDDVRIRVDILERTGKGSWNLVEVKSSTGVKDVYYPDVAVQFYVLDGCGLKISRAGILHIHNQYVYNGCDLDLNALFTFEDLTDQVKAMQPEIASRLAAQKAMLTDPDAPHIKPSRHCSKPYDCEFWDYCTKDVPEFWVFHINAIAQSKLDELARLGIEKINDIPDTFPLTEIQNRTRISVIRQQNFISDGLQAELDRIQHPIQFLDFETVAPPIPRYAGTRPYQTMPFQWSVHILYPDSKLKHRQYLCKDDKDPREEFTRTLLDALEPEGSIVIYTGYEATVLNSLITHLPGYAAKLQKVIERFVDLHAIIRNNYYHLKFYGSFSLKNVLPALVPEMTYDGLSIQDGIQAALAYLRMIDSSTPAEEKDRIRKDLLTYCGQDTLAMVKIREELLKRIADD